MANTVIPTATKNVSSHDLSKTLDANDNEFKFYYFKLHTHGATPRALLAYADAKWSNLYPVDWYAYDKPLTKFGTLPILFETSADGKTIIEHAEAMAIEIRLARKFNLLGSNSFEETQILGFFSSSRAIMHRQEDAYFSRSQVRDEERDTFIKTKLPAWIASHEKALEQNGSTGYYIGDKITLAEIKTAVAIEQLLNELYVFKGYEGIKELITPELTPNLWKVRENVRAKTSYKAWIESELFQDLIKGTTALFDHEYSEL
ncbi:hypothetical protein BGX28_006321 [Mortierella sp. GBA30]|nr:hypothetical protein BGX28_006321 [Mortierella sp. GBA30]